MFGGRIFMEREVSKTEKVATGVAVVGTTAFFLLWVIPVMLFMIFVGVAFFASL